MEDALRVERAYFCGLVEDVLILVLMEDALREEMINLLKNKMYCLNPCSNGRCSASVTSLSGYLLEGSVLILVLMEDALRGRDGRGNRAT